MHTLKRMAIAAIAAAALVVPLAGSAFADDSVPAEGTAEVVTTTDAAPVVAAEEVTSTPEVQEPASEPDPAPPVDTVVVPEPAPVVEPEPVEVPAADPEPSVPEVAASVPEVVATVAEPLIIEAPASQPVSLPEQQLIAPAPVADIAPLAEDEPFCYSVPLFDEVREPVSGAPLEVTLYWRDGVDCGWTGVFTLVYEDPAIPSVTRVFSAGDGRITLDLQASVPPRDGRLRPYTINTATIVTDTNGAIAGGQGRYGVAQAVWAKAGANVYLNGDGFGNVRLVENVYVTDSLGNTYTENTSNIVIDQEVVFTAHPSIPGEVLDPTYGAWEWTLSPLVRVTVDAPVRTGNTITFDTSDGNAEWWGQGVSEPVGHLGESYTLVPGETLCVSVWEASESVAITNWEDFEGLCYTYVAVEPPVDPPVNPPQPPVQPPVPPVVPPVQPPAPPVIVPEVSPTSTPEATATPSPTVKTVKVTQVVTGSSDEELASTGADGATSVTLGAVFMVAGIVLVAVRRRVATK